MSGSHYRALSIGGEVSGRRKVQGRLPLLVDDAPGEDRAGRGPGSENARDDVRDRRRVGARPRKRVRWRDLIGAGRPGGEGAIAAAAPGPRALPPLAPVVHPPAYRGVLAGWPDSWRERWGRRANELEDLGLSWRDAESQAFVEVWNARREADAPPAPAAVDPERN